jgi:hypothetical protein
MSCSDETQQKRIAARVSRMVSTIRRSCAAVDFSALGFGTTCPFNPAEASGGECGTIETADLEGLLDCFSCAFPALGGSIAATASP